VGTYAADDLRILSQKPVDYTTKKGFYIDLAVTPTATNKKGERILLPPVVWADRILFNTLVPSGDSNSCTGGTSGWLMEVDPLTGARTASSVFDLNGDGKYDDRDKSGTEVVNGTKFGTGITVVSDPETDEEIKYSSGSPIMKVKNKGSSKGRRSWRQIR
jgi:type IV pilus assembly protein PilY1